MALVNPHGKQKKLMPLLLTGAQLEEEKKKAAGLKKVKITSREAGDLIVSLAQRASAYYAPSAAAAEVADSLHMDLKRIFSLSVVLQGEYGIHGVALNLPCSVGAKGVERVLTPELDPKVGTASAQASAPPHPQILLAIRPLAAYSCPTPR